LTILASGDVIPETKSGHRPIHRTLSLNHTSDQESGDHMPNKRASAARAPTESVTITLPAGRAGFTTMEVAELLGISRVHVYNLLNAGEFVSFHIGRSRRITADSLADYVNHRIAAEATRPRRRVGAAKTNAAKTARRTRSTQTSADPAA
jgi:excisionase family DNA binding protein